MKRQNTIVRVFAIMVACVMDLWKVFTYRGDHQGYRGVNFQPKDKLHFTPEGYKLWAEALRPLLS